MPLHPQAQMIIEVINSAGLDLTPETTPDEARAALDQFSSVGIAAPVARVEDRVVPGPGGDIPIRIYWPTPHAEGLPVLVYFHGGGFVIGGIHTHDFVVRPIVNAVPCIVVSVEYRLAPEHRFPAAVDDAFAAARWVWEHAAELGGDPGRVALGGDSAGGTLSTVVSLLARDEGTPPLVFQLLVYPGTDHEHDSPSRRENATGYFLEEEGMNWFYSHYLESAAQFADWRVSPLRAPDLSGLPPALIITAEFDPLRDQGEEYGARMLAAGVSVDVNRYDGVFHGFFGMQAFLEPAEDAFRAAVDALRKAFGV